MSKAKISLASARSSDRPPVPWAEAGTPNSWGHTWLVEINTVADLARISQHAEDRLIVEFTDEGDLAEILIYDDHVE